MSRSNLRSYYQIPEWTSVQDIITWIEAQENAETTSFALSYAVEDLGSYGPDAIEPLIDRILHTDNLHMQCVAVRVLGALGDQRATEPLWTLYHRIKDQHLGLQTQILVALSHLQDVLLFDELVQLMEHEAQLLRNTAILALGNLGDNRAIPLLKTALQAEERLIHKVNEQYLDQELDPRQRQLLVEQVKQKFQERDFIIEALREIGGAAAVDLLTSIINADDVALPQLNRHDRLRCNAVAAVGMIEHPNSHVVLEAAHTHHKRGVRRMANRMLHRA